MPIIVGGPREPDPADIFDAQLPRYERLRTEVDFSLRSVMTAAGIKTHSVTSRVKEKRSFLEKIVRKDVTDPFTGIQDIVGARVVCLFLSDLPRLRAEVENAFDVLEVEDKVEGADVESFGYMSMHFICQLRSEHTGPRYDDLKGTVFEIQCRTILMDAWANVSHYLDYKGEASVPAELRRDFHALSGLFYVADRHFELFFEKSTGSREKAREELSVPQIASRQVPINLDTVLAFLGSRYPDREASDAATVSSLVEELANVPGYETLADLERSLDAGDDLAREYENEEPPFMDSDEEGAGEPCRYTNAGFARQSLAIADPAYEQFRYPHRLIRQWIASRGE